MNKRIKQNVINKKDFKNERKLTKEERYNRSHQQSQNWFFKNKNKTWETYEQYKEQKYKRKMWMKRGQSIKTFKEIKCNKIILSTTICQ